MRSVRCHCVRRALKLALRDALCFAASSEVGGFRPAITFRRPGNGLLVVGAGPDKCCAGG